MAKAYREGKTWSVRPQIDGERLYLDRFPTKSDAEAEVRRLVQARSDHGKPKHQGPHKTSVAKALQLMGVERLPFKKSAAQEANRINKYLRSAGLATLNVGPVKQKEQTPGETAAKPTDKKGGKLFEVSLVPPAEKRSVARGTRTHRDTLATRTQTSDRLRARLAKTLAADVTRHQVQGLVDALRSDGLSASSIELERSVLRTLFNHVRRSWHWTAPVQNPATLLEMPVIDNGRDRVMSVDEQERLDDALVDCRNELVAPVLTLLRETAMRSSEPLERAAWGDVDWDRKVLHLRDAKAGQRDVPLSPKAIEALKVLRELNPGGPDERIVQLSYEALKAAWIRACKRANITDLHMHDLRHTAATRMALKHGNLFLVQALTGHKTLSQVKRYVNVRADDVVKVMHADETASAPAAQPNVEQSVLKEDAVSVTEPPATAPAPAIQPEAAAEPAVPDNVTHVQFGKRRAA